MWKNKRPENWDQTAPFKNEPHDNWCNGFNEGVEAGADAMLDEFGKLDIVEILKILAEYFPDRYVRLGEDNEG